MIVFQLLGTEGTLKSDRNQGILETELNFWPIKLTIHLITFF